MSEVGVNLIVVRSRDLDAARAFYEAVGLSFRDEQHGRGPRHVAAVLASAVFEIYPASDSEVVPLGSVGDLRLGFDVDDIAAVVEAVVGLGGDVVSGIERRGDVLRAVLADPDGRRVEVTGPPRPRSTAG